MGLKYSIIDQNFLKKNKIRFNNNIFVAFGGGEDLEYKKKLKTFLKSMMIRDFGYVQIIELQLFF